MPVDEYDTLLLDTAAEERDIALADGVLSQVGVEDESVSLNRRTGQRRARTRSTREPSALGTVPIWRTSAYEARRAAKLERLKQSCPEITDILTLVSALIDARPDEQFSPHQLMPIVGERFSFTELLLALSSLVVAGLLAKRYTIVDPKSGKMAADWFDSVEDVPEVLDDLTLGPFLVRGGNIVDLYERI